MHILKSCFLFVLLLVACNPDGRENTSTVDFDICIYGATSGGIAAAIQAKRMGKSVLLLEPNDRIGGLTTGGLGQTDIGNKQAIGGISREFYQQIKGHYSKPSSWKTQSPEAYRDGGQTRTKKGEDAMWTFEPSAALKVYGEMLQEHDIQVQKGKKLNRENGVEKEQGKIIGVSMQDGSRYTAHVFIDATYEGDLLAAAGVSYIVGREANETYRETYNGVQLLEGHQFPDGVDPYKTPGDPTSGLLWGISDDQLADQGSGDKLVQAYNFRICLTNAPENMLPIVEPENYDVTRYELLARLFEAQPKKRKVNQYFIWSNMPNNKTDINNRGGFSTDMINNSHNYAEASWEERKRIIKEHKDYTQGLLYFYQNDPRVPDSLKMAVSGWGYPKDEYLETGNWSPQLYVREARRLVGSYVMTQANCVGEVVVEDPIGMAAYTMDSHNCQRIVVDGQVKNEGNVEVGGFPPYPIAYQSILPKKEECTNLLVPVCLSASHIAFGSIRMEPVFMVLGQSAATAAVLAIEKEQTLHELDYETLKAKLIEDKQIIGL